MYLLDDKKIRNNLTIVNRIARSIYTEFTVRENFIFPTTSDAVKEPDLFDCSFFIVRYNYFDFLENQVIIPELMTKALNDKILTGEYDEHKGWSFETKKGVLKYNISRPYENAESDRTRGQIALYRKIIEESKDTEYEFFTEIDSETKNRLLDYESFPIYLNNSTRDKIIKVIATLKLFPAIKQANKIEILGRSHKSGDMVYEIIAISSSEDWQFYSRHYIINI